MADLEGERGVVRLFFADFLVAEVGFVLNIDFPEALAQWNDVYFAFVVGHIIECLRFYFVGFAAVAVVKAVEGCGYRMVGQRFATIEYAYFKAFADVNVSRIVERYDF